MDNKSLKRYEYLDVAKGLGIIFIILTHMDVGFFPTQWMYSFDLPLFYVITGICFHYNDSFLEFIKKRAKRCLIPYFSLGIFVVLVESQTGYLYERGFKQNITRFLIQERYSTLWFLATLFIAVIIFYFVVKFCKQEPVAVLIVSLVLSVAFVYYDKLVGQSLPWNTDTAFIVVGFMGFGYFMKNYKRWMEKLIAMEGPKRIGVEALFLIINIVCWLCNMAFSQENLNLYWNLFGFYPLAFIAAICGTLWVLLISDRIHVKYLVYLGQCSMLFFAWHQSIFMHPYTILLRQIGIKDYKGGVMLVAFKIILFLMIMISCTVVDKAIRKTKLKFILGE